jgi:hypothetical protein
VEKKAKLMTRIDQKTSLFMIPSPQHASTPHASFS